MAKRDTLIDRSKGGRYTAEMAEPDVAAMAEGEYYPVEAFIRFSARWQNHWVGEDHYIGDGLPFAVVQTLARIEGRSAWDRRLPINYQRLQ